VKDPVSATALTYLNWLRFIWLLAVSSGEFGGGKAPVWLADHVPRIFMTHCFSRDFLRECRLDLVFIVYRNKSYVKKQFLS
jgi:hypothetical protein